MTQVYITQANLGLITRLVKFNGVNSIDDIYDSCLRSILSVNELNLLYVFKQTCELLSSKNGNQTTFETFSIPEVKATTTRWALEVRNPAYHLDASCERLSQDYLNVEVPQQVIDKGDAEVSRFRVFCSQHANLGRQNPRRYLELLEAHFFLQVSLKSVLLDNSGVSHFGENDTSQIKQQIDQLMSSADVFRFRDSETAKGIANKGYGTHKVKEAKIPGHPLHTWHNQFKEPLKAALRKYFMVKFNPSLSFDKGLLGQLGFNCCQQCEVKSVIGGNHNDGYART
jgi:hypothetical protein